MSQPSRSVTRSRCVTCGRKFAAHRADARYCSGRCRQRATRARRSTAEIDRDIEAARHRYWNLLRLKAEATGVPSSQVLTDEAHFVDGDGYVYACGGHIGANGRLVGRTTQNRREWSAWGLEATGPPFSVPPVAGRAKQAS